MLSCPVHQILSSLDTSSNSSMLLPEFLSCIVSHPFLCLRTCSRESVWPCLILAHLGCLPRALHLSLSLQVSLWDDLAFALGIHRFQTMSIVHRCTKTWKTIQGTPMEPPCPPPWLHHSPYPPPYNSPGNCLECSNSVHFCFYYIKLWNMYYLAINVFKHCIPYMYWLAFFIVNLHWYVSHTTAAQSHMPLHGTVLIYHNLLIFLLENIWVFFSHYKQYHQGLLCTLILIYMFVHCVIMSWSTGLKTIWPLVGIIKLFSKGIT